MSFHDLKVLILDDFSCNTLIKLFLEVILQLRWVVARNVNFNSGITLWSLCLLCHKLSLANQNCVNTFFAELDSPDSKRVLTRKNQGEKDLL
jgi:hypothetical protein